MNLNSSQKLKALQEAEQKAMYLFDEVVKRGFIQSGISEKELNANIYTLAKELFGIEKYWHKRIVRAGKNTLLPYQHNPPNNTIQNNDILFLDFGPVLEQWEADFGRTYVLGNNEQHIRLTREVEEAWYEGKQFYLQHKYDLTGADLYAHTQSLATKYGWEFGNMHCGHLIGNFPHEQILGDEIENYIHPNNHQRMSEPDILGQERFWIYEIHFINPTLEIGGFFEQLLAD